MSSTSDPKRPDRREFLRCASASAILAAFHPESLFGRTPITKIRSKKPLISSLRLLTAVPLEKMKQFYHGRLGLPVTTHTDQALTIQAGLTQITFVLSQAEGGSPEIF